LHFELITSLLAGLLVVKEGVVVGWAANYSAGIHHRQTGPSGQELFSHLIIKEAIMHNAIRAVLVIGLLLTVIGSLSTGADQSIAMGSDTMDCVLGGRDCGNDLDICLKHSDSWWQDLICYALYVFCILV
jgi:hypothetical protein